MVNSILSIFLALAMMMSGAFATPDETALASKVLTIGNVQLTINGEEYALNPQLRMGVQTQNGEALFDVGMPLEDRVLFPIQLKIAEDGITALAGSNTKAVKLPASLVEEAIGSEVPPEAIELLGSYEELILAVARAAKTDPEEMNEAMAIGLSDLINENLVSTEETTLNLTGTEEAADLVVCELGTSEIIGMVDMVYDMMPEVREAYFNFVNQLIALAAPSGETVPTFASFSDLFNFVFEQAGEDAFDMTMTATLTVGRESGNTDGDLVIAVTADDETVELPMHVTVVGDTVDLSYEMAVEEASLSMNVHAEGESQATIDYAMAADQVSMNMHCVVTRNDDGTGDVDMTMDIDAADQGHAQLTYGGMFADNGNGAGQLRFNINAEGTEVGFSVDLYLSDEPITDRIATAEIDEITALDETALTKLTLMAAPLASDADVLIHEDSVRALMDLFGATVGPMAAPEQPYSGYPEGYEPYNEYTPDEEPDENKEPEDPTSLVTSDGRTFVIQFDENGTPVFVESTPAQVEEPAVEEVPNNSLVITSENGRLVFNRPGQAEAPAPSIYADLPFTVPAFSWLPEGFELVDETVDKDEYSASATQTFADAAGDNTIVATFYEADTESTDVTYVMDEEGRIRPNDQTTITVTELSEETHELIAIVDLDGSQLVLYGSGENVDVDELLQMISGLTYAE